MIFIYAIAIFFISSVTCASLQADSIEANLKLAKFNDWIATLSQKDMDLHLSTLDSKALKDLRKFAQACRQYYGIKADEKKNQESLSNLLRNKKNYLIAKKALAACIMGLIAIGIRYYYIYESGHNKTKMALPLEISSTKAQLTNLGTYVSGDPGYACSLWASRGYNPKNKQEASALFYKLNTLTRELESLPEKQRDGRSSTILIGVLLAQASYFISYMCFEFDCKEAQLQKQYALLVERINKRL